MVKKEDRSADKFSRVFVLLFCFSRTDMLIQAYERLSQNLHVLFHIQLKQLA